MKTTFTCFLLYKEGYFNSGLRYAFLLLEILSLYLLVFLNLRLLLLSIVTRSTLYLCFSMSKLIICSIERCTTSNSEMSLYLKQNKNVCLPAISQFGFAAMFQCSQLALCILILSPLCCLCPPSLTLLLTESLRLLRPLFLWLPTNPKLFVTPVCLFSSFFLSPVLLFLTIVILFSNLAK